MNAILDPTTPEPGGAPPTSSIIRTGVDGRLRLSAAARAELLEAYDRSGMTAMAFARLHGVKYPTFSAWLAKRRRAGQPLANDPASAAPPLAGFAEVVGIDESAAPLRVQLAGGMMLEIHSRAALPMAAELLAMLRTRC
jgi:transposase-like protein